MASKGFSTYHMAQHPQAGCVRCTATTDGELIHILATYSYETCFTVGLCLYYIMQRSLQAARKRGIHLRPRSLHLVAFEASLITPILKSPRSHIGHKDSELPVWVLWTLQGMIVPKLPQQPSRPSSPGCCGAAGDADLNWFASALAAASSSETAQQRLYQRWPIGRAQ